MENYKGTVNGIDVHLNAGIPSKCFAFIKSNNGQYVQVVTFSRSLQTVLELACSKNLEVEVTYDDAIEKILTRVRILDRDESPVPS